MILSPKFIQQGLKMTDFFKNRTKLQLAGDVVVGAIGGARKGIMGGFLLSAVEGSVPTVGTIATMAGACALGGALLIIPAIIAHKMLISDPNSKTPFLTQMATITANVCFKAAFAYTSACVGAAILGLAITPIALSSLSASLAFGLIGLMTSMIVVATSPEEIDRDHYRAANLA